MAKCSWSGCDTDVGINPKTGREYYYCSKHTKIRNKTSRIRYVETHGQANVNNKKYIKSLRNKFLDMYGRRCACCGETFEDFLTLDHVTGDGKAERTTTNGKVANSYNAYRNAIKIHNTDKYQVLCMNCNFAKKTHKLCRCQCENFQYEDYYREG